MTDVTFDRDMSSGAVNDPRLLLSLYRTMVRIRRFEEEAGRLMEDATIPGGVHLSIGQEAVAAGVMAHLGRDDQMVTTHRGHGHFIAKGGQMDTLFAELLGRETGCCKGRAGSMHIADLGVGIIGANGIVGGGAPIAAGLAFASRYQKLDRVVCAFFGDGAVNEGDVHEALNMSAVLKLPVLWVCENNGYGEYTSQAQHSVLPDVASRAAGYGIPSRIEDGMDVTAVSAAAKEAIERLREGSGPILLEFKTYRFHDHIGLSGMGINYRDAQEVAEARRRDPIVSLRQHLIGELSIESGRLADIDSEAAAEVAAAIEFAVSSPLPSPDDLMDGVYVSAGTPR